MIFIDIALLCLCLVLLVASAWLAALVIMHGGNGPLEVFVVMVIVPLCVLVTVFQAGRLNSYVHPNHKEEIRGECY